ncbi:MAG: TIGR03089 family protein [Propionibacteriaceae bacterium]|nr:TIGR03089 family protein [Propionibacteriaceae bacterium]
MIADRLAARVRSDGGTPLLIDYDLEAPSRVELSARTFANWVDKTVHFLDSQGLIPGDPVALPVLERHSGHWVSLVWAFAVWQFGSDIAAEDQAELVVVGPDDLSPRPVTTVACSLHPLGFGFETLNPALADYREVLAEPDSHVAYPGSGHTVEGADVSLISGSRGQRLMLAPPHSAARALRALVGVLDGGCLVLVKGGTSRDWSGIARGELAHVG